MIPFICDGSTRFTISSPYLYITVIYMIYHLFIIYVFYVFIIQKLQDLDYHDNYDAKFITRNSTF